MSVCFILLETITGNVFFWNVESNIATQASFLKAQEIISMRRTIDKKKFLKSNQKARRTSKNREVALLNSPYHNSCHKWKHSCSHSITGLPCLIDIEKQILAFSGTIVKNYIGVLHLVRAQNFLDHGERNVSFSVHLV